MIFQLYVVLSPIFFRTSQWITLIRKLQPIKNNFTRNQETRTKFPFYLGFLMSQLYYIFVSAYAIYNFSQVTVLNYVAGYGILLLQFYYVYLYNFLLCLILNIILSRYKHLSAILAQKLDQMKKGNFKI